MLARIAALLFLLGSVHSLFKREKRSYDPFHDECAFDTSARQPCGRRHDTLAECGCKARGCCYDNSREVEPGVPRCFLAHRMLAPQCAVDYKDKDDCGYYGMTEGACLIRGCCWRPSPRVNDPDCFHPVKAGVRLMKQDVESDREGRVEIQHNGEWGTVCDDAFETVDAGVVCRQLGYDNGIAECCAANGEGSGKIWMDQVDCDGTESALEDCTHDGWERHDCSHSEDVSVVCYNDGDPVPTENPPYNYNNYYYSDYDYKTSGKKSKKNGQRKQDKKWIQPPAQENGQREQDKKWIPPPAQNNGQREQGKKWIPPPAQNNGQREQEKKWLKPPAQDNGQREQGKKWLLPWAENNGQRAQDKKWIQPPVQTSKIEKAMKDILSRAKNKEH